MLAEECAPARVFQVYGLHLRSPWPLACPPGNGTYLAEVEVREEPPMVDGEMASNPVESPQSRDEWFHWARLPDGADYVRWRGLFECLVSPDGRRITTRLLNGYPSPATRTFLLSQTLSFALLKQGLEPLHATVIETAAEAVAFVGGCGYGQSTMAAAFLRSGARLITDDLLVLEVRDRSAPQWLAQPGFPRIKLFPDSAKALLAARTLGEPLMPGSQKLVYPLPEHWHTQAPRPLKAIYMLAPPVASGRAGRVTITRLSKQESCMALVANTFNPLVTDPDRLRRQFELAVMLAGSIPVKSLSYPRHLARLPGVLDAIAKDLAQ